jgi:hypothetical protein
MFPSTTPLPVVGAITFLLIALSRPRSQLAELPAAMLIGPLVGAFVGALLERLAGELRGRVDGRSLGGVLFTGRAHFGIVIAVAIAGALYYAVRFPGSPVAVTNVAYGTFAVWFVGLIVTWVLRPGMNLPLPISRKALAVLLAIASILGGIATIEDALKDRRPAFPPPPRFVPPTFTMPSFEPPPTFDIPGFSFPVRVSPSP